MKKTKRKRSSQLNCHNRFFSKTAPNSAQLQAFIGHYAAEYTNGSAGAHSSSPGTQQRGSRDLTAARICVWPALSQG